MEKWGLKNSAQTLSFTLNSRFALLATSESWKMIPSFSPFLVSLHLGLKRNFRVKLRPKKKVTLRITSLNKSDVC
jgi:hypothetical protein